MHIKAATVDDLMLTGLRTLRRRGVRIDPTKGACRELYGCTFTLTNPRARLSRSSGRGIMFSALGELCWYLAGSDSTEFISYYISDYVNYDEEGVINGAYGPRLFGSGQIQYVIQALRTKPSTRQAVVQIYDHRDVATSHEDVPCTCTIQFLIRNSALVMITNMRSNDAWKGFPHDVFCFTFLQEIISRELDVPVGEYIHLVGSYHLYETESNAARHFVNEGWQGTSEQMPEMPPGSPAASVARLLEHEQLCRVSGPTPADRVSLDPYWADLADCLAIFGYIKQERTQDARRLTESLHPYFRLYVNRRLGWK